MWDFLTSLLCLFLGICQGDSCRTISHARVDHTVCSFSVSQIETRLFLNDTQNRPFGRLSRLENALDTAPAMLMNGGMYHDDLSPVGLYVEKGNEKKSISTKGGWGNFHLLPNGVFWGKGDRLGVTETKAFLKEGRAVDFATQSGPMLVIDGKLHPRFLKDSDSLKIRNGVGISDDGNTVHFAISHGPVSFWNFGRLFQMELQTPNALFLDGTVSAIRAKGTNLGGWRQLGPMIGVFKRQQAQ